MLDEYFHGSPDVSGSKPSSNKGSNNNSKQITINKTKNKTDM